MEGINSVLVEVETDEGLVGVGEACGDRSAEVIVGILKAAERLLGERIISKSSGSSTGCIDTASGTTGAGSRTRRSPVLRWLCGISPVRRAAAGASVAGRQVQRSHQPFWFSARR